MQLYTLILPLPCLTIFLACLLCICSPSLIQHQKHPSDVNLLILVSSNHTTLLQSSTVQCWCIFANSSLFFKLFLLINGFSGFAIESMYAFFKILRTVQGLTLTTNCDLRPWVTQIALSLQPLAVCLTQNSFYLLVNLTDLPDFIGGF